MLTDIAPANRQAKGLLAYLIEALDQDKILEAAIGTPGISATAEHEPIGRGAERLEVFMPQLPALCYVVKGSTPKSSACFDGWLDDVDLVLVRTIPRPMMDDDEAVRGEAVARRWLMIVVERIAYWLQRAWFPPSPQTVPETTWADKLGPFGVERVEIKRVAYSVKGSWAEARIQTEVTRFLSPWTPATGDTTETGDALVSGTGALLIEQDGAFTPLEVDFEVDLDA